MIHRCAIVFSLLTIASLNTILLFGAVVRDPESIRTVFNGVVLVIDLSLVSSSLLLGFLFFKHHASFLSSLFLLNVVLFIVASILRIRGAVFPPILLYGADLYWLNLYLVVLSRYRPLIRPRVAIREGREV